MQLLPTWMIIKLASSSKSAKASAFTLAIVPILARVSAAFNSQQQSNWLIHFLDFSAVAIPTNMLRCFWSAVLVLIATLLYRLFCPKIISSFQNKEEWLEKSEQALLLKKKERIDVVIAIYDSDVLSLQNTNKLVRVIITMLFIASLYLLALVALEQILLVANNSDLLNIIRP